MSIREINMALARALGVPDAERASKITLTISPHDLPTLVVERFIVSEVGAVAKAIDRLKICAVHDGPTPEPTFAKLEAQAARMYPGGSEVDVTGIGDAIQRIAIGSPA